MKILKLKHIKSLNDKDFIYVNRGIINFTVAQIMCNKSRNPSESDAFLIDLLHELTETEYATKTVIPYVKMQFKDVKLCFPEYETLPRGTFCK